MADFYLDISAIGNEYQAYADTPTAWGVPQDGNGLAGPGHAAAVSVAEVTFAAIPTTGTVSVMGTTVTLTGVLSAASTDAAATALASSINATTTATPAAVCQLLLGLRYFVYARVKPGFASTVQIMCRIAGADLNYPANSSARVTNSLNNAAMATADFTGGLDGPYAYFLWGSTIFGKAELLYGIFPASGVGPATPAQDDPIFVRTKRSAANITLTVTTTTGTKTVVTDATAGRNFIFDNGTDWVGDNGQFQFEVRVPGATSVVTFGAATSRTLRMTGREKHNARILISTYQCSSNAYYAAFYGASNTNNNYENIEIGTMDPATYVRLTSSGMCSYRGCITRHMKNRYGALPISGGTLLMLDTEINYTIGADLGDFISYAAGTTVGTLVALYGCEFKIDGGASLVSGILSATPILINGRMTCIIENCKGVRNTSANFAAGGNSTLQPCLGSQYYWSDVNAGRSLRFETHYVVCDWDASGVYPSLTAVTPEGAPFAIRVNWGSARLQNYNGINFANVSTLTQVQGTSVTLELLAPTAEVPTKAQLSAVVKYVDVNDVPRVETIKEPMALHLAGLATPLVAGVGTGAWALAGLTGLGSYKLALTTAQAIKANTEVRMSLFLNGSPVSDRLLYINPELTVA